jgi:hypothetical protein
VGKLKRIYSRCHSLQNIYKFDDDKLIESYDKYNYFSLDIISEKCIKTNEICNCGNKFEMESKTSEHICMKCGMTEKIYGIIFEDEQLFYQEGQRTKHCRYDPTKHCKFWVDRIQARENDKIPDSLIESMRSCIIRDKIWLDSLTCNMVRRYLKELRKTIFNNHIPLIKKKLTGIEPPELTENELTSIYVYFNRVIQIYNVIKPKEKSNSIYHPFFVYKILEQLLRSPESRKKRNEILSSIHLQSRETLIDHDLIWKEICKYVPEFDYLPTDGTKMF